jgi:hypothetical protein
MIETIVPPNCEPTVGIRPETVGVAAYVNRSAGEVAEIPSGVVTVTFTMPVPGGLAAVIKVPLTTVKLVAGVDPKSTAVAPVKPLPVIATDVPPVSGPADGLKRETVTP